MDTKVIEHPSPVVKPGCLVFDIGANTGYISDLWLRAGASRVVCVEPCLKNFVELAKRPDIVPIHAAVWGTRAILPISYCNNQGGLSTCDPARWGALFPEATYDAPEYVPAITLNELASTFGIPHLVKVDVEGAELQVISAMAFKPQYLIFEYHRNYLNESLAILMHLQKLGFTRVAHADGELNIDLDPNASLSKFMDFWKAGQHGLGNITAA